MSGTRDIRDGKVPEHLRENRHANLIDWEGTEWGRWKGWKRRIEIIIKN